MSTPKSQTKTVVKKGSYNVEYTSNLDATQYYIFELSRAALRDVGKFVTKLFNLEYYKNFHKITGASKKATKYQVVSGKNTKFPKVQIGLKTGKVDGFYAYFQEFGTKDGRVPKLGILTRTVNDNVAEIIKIESQYLSGLSGEASRLEAEIDEKEFEGGDE